MYKQSSTKLVANFVKDLLQTTDSCSKNVKVVKHGLRFDGFTRQLAGCTPFTAGEEGARSRALCKDHAHGSCVVTRPQYTVDGAFRGEVGHGAGKR